MSRHHLGPGQRSQWLGKVGGPVRGLAALISRTKVVGSIMNNWPGPMRCLRAGVESGSGPKQPDGHGRKRASIPSFIPTITSPGFIFMGSRKSGYCSTAIRIVDGY